MVLQQPGSDADPTQEDLSGLSVKEMSATQRAELKRRFNAFRQAFAGESAEPKPAPKNTRKWVPGMKA